MKIIGSDSFFECVILTLFMFRFVESQADLMWSEMSDQVKNVYGKEYFDKKVCFNIFYS